MNADTHTHCILSLFGHNDLAFLTAIWQYIMLRLAKSTENYLATPIVATVSSCYIST